MATEFYAKMSYGIPPVATALLRVDDGVFGLFFDKATGEWTWAGWVVSRVTEDTDMVAITADEAAAIEARFKA